MPHPSRPLIVRLRNWVGDVTLGVPTLERLAAAGYSLQLQGKGWAADLLAAYGWPLQTLAPTLSERVAQLRALRAQARAADPGFERRLNSICFPFSFGSALEFRLAGLRAVGQGREARGWLLGRSLPRPQGLHELQVYWQFADVLLGQALPAPPAIGLRLAPRHREEAAALRQRYAIGPGYIVVCPFAGGTYEGADKSWPGFADFVRDTLPAFGRPLVCCPGPAEVALARERFAGTTVVEGTGLGAYAALLADAALMISNDTGPGHIAAAVGTPVLSVLGPTDPGQWGAWGPNVTHLKRWPGWPTADEVAAAAGRLLKDSLSTKTPA